MLSGLRTLPNDTADILTSISMTIEQINRVKSMYGTASPQTSTQLTATSLATLQRGAFTTHSAATPMERWVAMDESFGRRDVDERAWAQLIERDLMAAEIERAARTNGKGNPKGDD